MKKIIIFIIAVIGFYSFIGKGILSNFKNISKNHTEKIQEVAKTLDLN